MKNDIGQPLPGDIPPAADAGGPGPREPQPAKVYLYREIAPANLVRSAKRSDDRSGAR